MVSGSISLNPHRTSMTSDRILRITQIAEPAFTDASPSNNAAERNVCGRKTSTAHHSALCTHSKQVRPHFATRPFTLVPVRLAEERRVVARSTMLSRATSHVHFCQVAGTSTIKQALASADQAIRAKMFGYYWNPHCITISLPGSARLIQRRDHLQLLHYIPGVKLERVPRHHAAPVGHAFTHGRRLSRSSAAARSQRYTA